MQELKPEAEQQQQQLKCPRCESPNTKFCYYNNYNLSQPRHFCKDCRRYWTKGGALRNVPIGGSTRSKTSKRPSSSKRPSPSPVSPDRHTISSILPPVDPDDWLLNFNDGFCSLLAPSATFGDLLDDSRSGGAVAESLPGSSGFGMELQQSSSDSNGNEGVLLLPETGDGCWPDLAIYSPGSSSK